MIGQILAGFVLGLITLGAADDPNPVELVTQLGAPRFTEREVAGETLVKIGRVAIPALQKACGSSDTEVRRRAEILVVRIEAGEILAATRLRLDIRGRPLAEAAEAIARASGMALKPGIDRRNYRAGVTWLPRQVTVQAPEPLPFWDVVDKLCRAGGLQRESPNPENDTVPFKPPFVLTLVPGKAQPPACDIGALRVELSGVIVRREPDYGSYDPRSPRIQKKTTPEREADTETGSIKSTLYLAGLLVSPEPRLRILGVGQIDKPEAIDDRGRSLWKAPTPGEEERQLAHLQVNPHIDPRLHPGLRFVSGLHHSVSARAIPVKLLYPSPPARRIALFRGVIPVAVVARRPDPLIIPLKDAPGKAFSAGPTKITVHEINAQAGGGPTVDFSLETGQPGAEATIMACDLKGARLAVNTPLDLMRLRLEVVDSRGETLPWEFSRTPTQRTQGRMAIGIYDKSLKKVRVEDLQLRCWSIIAAVTELPFVFKDIPVPENPPRSKS